MEGTPEKQERNLHTLSKFTEEPVQFLNELINLIQINKLPKAVSRLETFRDDIVYKITGDLKPLTREDQADFGEDKNPQASVQDMVQKSEKKGKKNKKKNKQKKKQDDFDVAEVSKEEQLTEENPVEQDSNVIPPEQIQVEPTGENETPKENSDNEPEKEVIDSRQD